MKIDNIGNNILSAALTIFLGAFSLFAMFCWLGNVPAFWCISAIVIICVSLSVVLQYRGYRNRIDEPESLNTAQSQELSEGIEKYASDSSYRFELKDSDSLKWQKRELNFIFEEAASTSRLKSELIRNVAHEIKTPLTSLQIVAEGLEDGIFTVDDGTSLSQITDSVNRLNTTVKMMSAYVSSGAEALQNETSDLAVCLIAAYKKACETAKVYDGVEVSLRSIDTVESGSMLVSMSSQALDAVLYSVVSNAFEHAHGMKNLVFSLEAESHPVSNKRMAKVSISDDGCGAPTDSAYKMCEPFWKADESHTLGRDKVSSPGLGLSIVKEMISHSGGNIDIQCAEGHGTCVSIWLPISA